MSNFSRISSILNTPNLELDFIGISSFNLLNLNIIEDINFELPTNLRLGHLAEKVVSNLIKSSSNYNILFENTQLIEDNKTIGEIDFILSEKETQKVIHLELAYKFYLFDPNHSSDEINNWVGPNKNDSLIQKLNKTKTKQFPLLHHKVAQEKLNGIDLKKTSQNLCLLASLYIPHDYRKEFDPNFKKGIKGYYLTFKKFKSLDKTEKLYRIPPKKEWGIEPSENKDWYNSEVIEKEVETSIAEKRSILCWEKQKNTYSQFFIIWW